jgi:hypothetical protein
MNDFVMEYLAHKCFLNGNDFMELANTCKRFRKYNKDKYIRKLWKHGAVENVKTAFYVEKLLKKYRPREILGETTNIRLEKEVVSVFRRILSTRKMFHLARTHSPLSRSLFAKEKVTILGKRFR